MEHVKSVVSHSFEQKTSRILETGTLSKEAGVFSAMALNRFIEAQGALELSLKILAEADRSTEARLQACAETLHELGHVFRYQGSFKRSEEALRHSLEI